MKKWCTFLLIVLLDNIICLWCRFKFASDVIGAAACVREI